MTSLPGLPHGQVFLSEADPLWPALFEQEAGRIRTRLGPAILAIEHYGSTSVPGLKAKPVIDLLIGVRKLEDALDQVLGMESLGYDFAPHAGVEGHHIFGLGRDRTHLAHFVEHEGERWQLCLKFRDRLRSDPAARQAYQALKEDLAARYPDDRAAYTQGKTAFVLSLI